MSRKIKFRVYSNYYKKYLDTSGEGIFCEVHHLALKPDGKLYYADIGIEYPGTLSECPTLEWEEDYDDCVVEQCTGFKDKNGKEIYEGDIVKITRELTKTRSAVYIYQIRYDVSRAAFTCWKNNHFACMFFAPCEEVEYEVIGSIHENPELLGGEE